MNTNQIIFDTAYSLASELTGIKPARMGEDEKFDAVFDAVQESLYKIVEEYK